jgi:hypothetical protein
MKFKLFSIYFPCVDITNICCIQSPLALYTAYVSKPVVVMLVSQLVASKPTSRQRKQIGLGASL